MVRFIKATGTRSATVLFVGLCCPNLTLCSPPLDRRYCMVSALDDQSRYKKSPLVLQLIFPLTATTFPHNLLWQAPCYTYSPHSCYPPQKVCSYLPHRRKLISAQDILHVSPSLVGWSWHLREGGPQSVIFGNHSHVIPVKDWTWSWTGLSVILHY